MNRLPVSVLLAAICLCTPVLPGALIGQSGERLVDIRTDVYDAAMTHRTRALDSLIASRGRFNAALFALERAGSSGDEGVINQAHAQVLASGRDMSARLALDLQAADTLAVRRAELLSVLIAWRNEIFVRLEGAPEGAERERDIALLEDVGRRIDDLRTLEAQSPAGGLVGSLVEHDDRDGEMEWRSKAEICRRLAEEVGNVIAVIDDDLEQLGLEQSLERQRRDFMIETDLFGDRSLATGSQRRAGDVQVADSGGVGALPMTIEDRIAVLQRDRATLVDYRDRLLEREREFLAKIGGGAR